MTFYLFNGMLVKFVRFIVLFFYLSSCNKPVSKPLFTLVENSGIEFKNAVTETKENNVFKYRNFYNGGGVGTGDFNNDGLADIFFTANQTANKLYINSGNFHFDDISDKAGLSSHGEWGTGVVLADVNADGWLDIYVCNAGNMLQPDLRKNQLYINNHNLTFTDSATEYGLDNNGYTTQASFFDYDLDGDLDCFMVNNSPIPVNTLNYSNQRDLPIGNWPVADFLKGGGDRLYRNDKGKFIEVTKESGIHGGLVSLGLGVTVGDVNSDGYPDIYVSNDFFERDYLYINLKDGTFRDELEQRVQHTSLSSMGADMQDINNDGLQDIFTTDMLPGDDFRLKTNTSFENYDVFKIKQNKGFYNQFTQNALQVNDKEGHFLETGFYSGIAASDWSWGAIIFDADNDGLSDIYVCNGIYRDVTDQDFIDFFANDVMQEMVISGKKEEVNTITEKMPSNPLLNFFYQNLGNLHFKENGQNWGFTSPSFSNGASYADLDNDGDLDLIVNNVNQKAFIYKNNSRELNKNNYLAIKINFRFPNLFGIGTGIKIYQAGKIISRQIIPSRGFQSSVDYIQTIGLGNSNADSMIITWPDRSTSLFLTPALNKLTVVKYDSVQKRIPAASIDTTINKYFKQVSNSFDKHVEDDHVDFYYERNIPFMVSREGPKGVAGDVNNDGLEDVFIGGAKDQPSQLYLQSSNGFVKKNVPDFVTFSFNDVTAVFFFDCDKDGDLDLFTGGGGNFASESSSSFQSQLFINDGIGNFVLKRGALPIINTNCGFACSLDFDGDGNLDLFIGSRSVPQNYGLSPKSFLLHNDGNGNFSDVTRSIAPEFSSLGMVTAAIYADINNDGKSELVITGDWMYPHVFSYQNNKFIELKSGLEELLGWWKSMLMADVDQDGDQDLLLGNMGENFYLNPSKINPVKMWISDFDSNGTTDKILSKTLDGKDVPVFMKKDITEQIPALKKLNLKNEDYAKKTIQTLFGSKLNKAEIKQVNYTSSCIAYNNGKGHFSIKSLPMEVQLSSVNALRLIDINHDSYPDLIAAGNCIDMIPQFCRVDASYGNILFNDKKGNFVTVPANATGIHVNGEVRDIINFKYKQKEAILFLENNAFPKMFTLN
jgi:hypothetical protein